MPLLLIDLDNTLVDRELAYRNWAADFVADLGADTAHVEWLVSQDNDGLRRREQLATDIASRFGLDTKRREALVHELRLGLVERIELDPLIPVALQRLRNAGWQCVVVTNGTVSQQERKLRHTGLDSQVDGWAISEGVGARKPEAAIFEYAARSVGATLDDAWVIGDADSADIAGAHALGLPSVWLHRGRVWQRSDYTPTHQAASCPEAISLAELGLR